MTAVVLCGGFGTRLRSVVGSLPKVLAPVGGHPFLHHVLTYLRRQGIADVVLATGYGAKEVATFGGDGSAWGVRLRYSAESEPLGTAGALRLAGTQGLSDPFLALNGDSLVPANLWRVLDFHCAHAARVTLVLTQTPNQGRFGSVRVEPDGRIVEFVEKGTNGPGLINAGIYVMQREVLGEIPAGRCVSLEHEVFPSLVGKGIYGIEVAGPFVDIGTPQALAEAQALFTQRGEGWLP